LRQLEPYASGATPKRRTEIIFEPRPVANDTVVFPYSVYTDQAQMITGGSSAGSSTTLADASLINLYPDDYFNGWVIKIISGTGKFNSALVTDYAGSTGVFTVAAWLSLDGSTVGVDVGGGINPEDKSFYVATPPTALHPAGLRFDDYVLAACMAKAEQEIEDFNGRGFVEKFYKVDVKMAHTLDARSAPRKLGSMNKTGTNRKNFRERTWNDATFN
jgi:hypothetical protein